MLQQYPSTLLEKAVGEFAKLPGIGRKTALRLVLHMLRQPMDDVDVFTQAMGKLRHEVKYCDTCHNISDTTTCPICADPRRDTSIVCVVENVQDVMAVENTQQFHGLYHVLGGVISRKLSGYDVRLTVLARGISVGDELEYTDEVTLGRSIINRTPFGQ